MSLAWQQSLDKQPTFAICDYQMTICLDGDLHGLQQPGLLEACVLGTYAIENNKSARSEKDNLTCEVGQFVA